MQTINLLIADDHPIFLAGLREILDSERNMKVVFSATNGEDAVNAARLKDVDVIILDIDMPAMNGLEAAEQVLKFKPESAIILLTMHKAKDAFLRALEIGVMGYVLKENAVTEIIHAVLAVAQGNSYTSPELRSTLLKHKHKRNVAPAGSLDTQLTPAELKILQMIGSYKSSREIADELCISEKTVSNHRTNISKKLNLTGKNSLLRFAMENQISDKP